MLTPRDLPLLPVFVAVATSGSFTAAARELRLAKSVVSQHVRTLEERCGVRLMERSTRRLSLTQIGEQVFDAAQAVLLSVRSLEQVIEGHRQVPSGTLRVTVPVDASLSAVIAPIVTALTQQHSSLKAELEFDDAARDLVEGRWDIALRLGPLAASNYIAKRLGSVAEIIVANPAVVDDWRKVDQPRDLANAPWVAHSSVRVRSTWTFRSQKGDSVAVAVDVRTTTNSAIAVRDLLLAGAGFAVVPACFVYDDLRSGRLRHVCSAWFHRRLSLHALLATRQSPPRVRAFLAAFAAALRPLGFDAS